ncbi:MAG: baseplate J/gp47 family protein, partial [Mariprofundaceae bacterium]|nr:baseplate J/gp47 family protein [Mariprofundaceae bacterium]
MSLGIDLSRLPPPAVIDTLDYETILQQMQAEFAARWPQYSYEPHDPVTKVLEVTALRELLVRQRHNEHASQIMLAHARGSNLDALGALPWLQVTRLTITPADNTTVPPTPAVMESDDAFRKRMLLAYNQLSTAGATGSYQFHALSASGQ